MRATLAIILTLASAACGACASTSTTGKPADAASAFLHDYATPEGDEVDQSKEAQFNDLMFDRFLADLLEHDTRMTPEQKSMARMMRLGIMMGSLMYFYGLQSSEAREVIKNIADAHARATAQFYEQQQARQRHLDDPTPAIPQQHRSPARPMQEHGAHGTLSL